MKLLTRIGAIIVAAIIPVIALAAPANAANSYPYLVINNSGNSTGVVKVYSSRHPGGVFVLEGHSNSFNNDDGSVRVDVDPEFPGDPDVGSFWWGYEGQGLDYCVSGEPTRWDPPNFYLGYIKINTDQSGC